jgi:hypothetical protein
MTAATALSFLTAAQHLLQQAVEQAPDLFGHDLEEALRLLSSEISDATNAVQHAANVQLAERLGPGFAYIPD